MDWHWQLHPAGVPVSAGLGANSRFPSQSEAETWLGESWRELAAEGVESVTLYEADRLVYGPMSLASPS